MTEDLKPCPFCGFDQVHTWHISHYDRPWVVECWVCLTQGPHASTEDFAIKLWNERAKE